jgi:alkaline phosphatase
MVPLGCETLGGEDVIVYATGPGSALVKGVKEQNAIFHMLNQAGGLKARTIGRTE